MQITLRPPFEKLVEEKVKTGDYRTADEVVEAALTLLSDQVPEFTPEHEAYIRRCLNEADEDLQSGRIITVDERGLADLCEDAIVKARQRAAARTQS